MNDRRSRSPWCRLHRLVSRRGWGLGSLLLLLVGVALIFLALEGGAAFQPPETAADIANQTRADLRLAYVLIGLVVAGFAIYAGISHLAEPVARKAVADHSKDPDAHGRLASVVKLEEQFEKVTTLQGKVLVKLATMDQRVKDGFENLPCRGRDDRGCLGIPGEINGEVP